MKSAFNASRGLLSACLFIGIMLLACNVGQETKFENSLSYSKFFNSLARYDRIVIEVKEPGGRSLGIIYQGKPSLAAELDHLMVPGWDGGPIDIIVTGYMNGQEGPVYQEKKRYDGNNNKTESTVVIINPNPVVKPPDRLTLDQDTVRLAVRGGGKRFTAQFDPPGSDQQIVWRLSDTTLAALRTDGAFIGLAQGTTKVWASAKLKPEVVDSGWIVVTEAVPVASVRFLNPEPMVLFLGGASETLLTEVLPDLANAEVGFSLSDSLKATLAGRVLTPKAAGSFTIKARSLEDSTKTATLTVIVREPIHITQTVAVDSAVTLFLGGPGLTLIAKVLPDSAPQDVRWKSLSPTLVSANLTTGAIAPLQAGLARIVAASAADSAKSDTVSVTVKVDAPRLAITADSVVSAGANVAFHVNAVQEFGQIILFQWDLDGNGVWDDSLTGPWTGANVDLPTVTSKYDKSGPVVARFRVRDTEGNPGLGSYALRVVGGSAVSIEAPKNNSYTNQKRIVVDWSVNGVPQDSLKSQDLVVGPNVISRSARDSAGKMFTANVTVTLDTTAPLKPLLSGSSPTNVKPQWSWVTGGGGSGEYRYRLVDAAFPADAPTVRDSTYILAQAPVSGTTYTLFVEERDLAGNWSLPASLPIRYDVSTPVVTITSPQTSGTFYTSTASVTMSGTASGPLAISEVNYKVGAGTAAKATLTAAGWTTAAISLTEGSNVAVTVTATDLAGNTGSAVLNLMLDATVPSAPAITTAPAAEITAIKGDFAWTPGTDGTAGSGLNGHYRYSLNGSAFKDTTAALLINVPLLEGSNIFSVQEQDRALLWSASATRNILVDTTGPVITLTSHTSPATSPSLTITVSGSVKDNGTSVAAMTVSGQQTGSGTVAITAGTWTTAALTLKTGANSLLFTATDRLGNARTLPLTVNVNVPAPVVVITKPTDSLTVTKFDTINVFYTIDGGAAQSQNKTLTEGVNRVVIASPANTSGNIGRDTVKVTMDATAPNAPTLTRGTTPSNTAATWTWTANGDNTGGAGLPTTASYRYSLNNGTTWTQTGTAQFQQTTEGTWTLIVQVQDKAGNWSASSTAQTMVVDKTKPVVVITGPRDNYVTSVSGSVTITYTVDGGTTPLTTPCAMGTTEGAKTCTASATDNANNTGTDAITVYYRPNVVFVTLSGAGAKTGTTWETAMDPVGLSTAMGSASFAGKTFWVGSGIITERLQASYSMSLYGGFDATLKPHDLTGRNPLGTRVTAYVQATPASGLTVMTFNLDGFVLETFGADQLGNTVNLTNITFDPESPFASNALYLLDDVVANVTNVTIKGESYSQTVVANYATFNMVGGSITGNFSDYPAVESYGKITMTNGALISGNTSASNPPYQVHLNGGSLTIGAGVVFTCFSPNTLNNGGSCTDN